MELGTAFLLLVSLVVSAGIAAVGQLLGNVLPVPEVVLHAVNFVISFVIVSALFGLMYKVLPDAEIAWHALVIAAVVGFGIAIASALRGAGRHGGPGLGGGAR